MTPVQVWGGAMHVKGWGYQKLGTAEESENSESEPGLPDCSKDIFVKTR